jgi:hypothetical protein
MEVGTTDGALLAGIVGEILGAVVGFDGEFVGVLVRAGLYSQPQLKLA